MAEMWGWFWALGVDFISAMETPRDDLQDRRLAALERDVARLTSTARPDG